MGSLIFSFELFENNIVFVYTTYYLRFVNRYFICTKLNIQNHYWNPKNYSKYNANFNSITSLNLLLYV